MNIPQAQIITHFQANTLISALQKDKKTLSFLADKHQLVAEDGQEWRAKIYLPWTIDWVPDRGLTEKPDSHYSLVLIRAGQAATGYFHQGELIDHKVFNAYMVRQKQGVSQIKYLKTKGKSRAGSRVRLAETERFFKEINERLNSYSDRFPIDYWGISCAKTMWPFYFSSVVPPPFSPKENNLIELPVHIAQASFEELKAAGQLLQKFHLILSEKGKEDLSHLLEKTPEKEDELSEDW